MGEEKSSANQNDKVSFSKSGAVLILLGS